MGLYEETSMPMPEYAGLNPSSGSSGLLDMLGNWAKDPKNNQTLMAFGANLLSGRKANVGTALNAAMEARNGFDKNEQTKKVLGMQSEMQALQMQKLKQDMSAKVDPRSFLGKVDLDKFESASIPEFLESGDFSKLKLRSKVEVAPSGETFDPFVTPTGINMGAPIKVDTGNAVGFLNPGTLQPISSFWKAQSPDSLAANKLGWDNNSLARENQNMPVIQSGPNGEVFSIDRRKGVGAPVMTPSGQPLSKGEKPLTEYQGKSTGFGLRSIEADKIISGLGTDGVTEVGVKRSMENIPVAGGLAGAAANASISPKAQLRDQAERDFTNAVLRQESGAAINKDEFENARRQYFPRVGDSPEVIKQKAANRATAIQGFTISSGPGAKNFKPKTYVETRKLPDGRVIGMKADGTKEIVSE